MKKITALLLALVLMFSMATVAFADGENNGTITVNNAEAGETYTIYRLLDLESYDAKSGAYAYKANATWKKWLEEQTTYVAIDKSGYVTWKTGADAAAFAKLALAYATTNDIASQDSVKAQDATVEFTGLALGYYLVDSSVGALCGLTTTKPDAEVNEKNAINVDKQVKEDATGNFGDSDDADIGQTVNFKTNVTVKPGAKGYVLHDIMSEGLTLDQNSIAIEGLTEGTDYTVEFDQGCKDKNGNEAYCDFHIVFAQDYLDKVKNQTVLAVTYSAVVNENAVVGLPGNPNETRLQYSNDNYTDWDTTITYTWDLDVLKYGKGVETKVLEGAKFVLLNKEKTHVAIIENDKMTGWVAVPAEDAAWPTNTELTTDANGKIAIDGLDADTYYLRETQAPAGYNKLAEDVEVVISGASQGEGGTLTYTTVVAKVYNQTGTELPETGAMGTMMFITFGMIVVLGAGVLLVTKKRMSMIED